MKTMIWTSCLWLLAAPCLAESPPATDAVAEARPQVALDQLASFGDELFDLAQLKDNQFLYTETADKLIERAPEFTGAETTLHAEVIRVTQDEVFVELSEPGRTRIAFRHLAPPWFGNNRSLCYPGTPSTELSHLFSKPVGLRIGQEIDFELAKTLRARDGLALRVAIEEFRVRVASVFEPTAIAIVVPIASATAER